MPVRQLGNSDRHAVERILNADPIAAAQVVERINARGLTWWRSQGRLYGYGDDEIESLCWFGVHIIPVLASPPALSAFAELLSGQPRTCASVVGRSSLVLPLWQQLTAAWGPAREIREDQPLLVAADPPPIPVDPAVRVAHRTEVDALFPAAVAMYTEEIGSSPIGSDGGAGYRARLADLVRGRRAYARIEDGEVIFKAELAIVTPDTAQVQGVWVAPAWRGRGIAAPAMAAVVADALERVAPTVSLYVNAHNTAARRTYQRCGFRQTGTFATVLF